MAPFAGNQARLRMQPGRAAVLQRQCACGGTCTHCSGSGALRRSPAISEPGDVLEMEAERVAEQVMRMPAPASTQATPASGPRQAAAPSAGLPPIVSDVLRSPGRPLDGATRAFMEPRFGHEFGTVRVHTDARAAESARSVNALAYTVGNDIAFAGGRYEPDTPSGRRLIAHELAHVVQQGEGLHRQDDPAATATEAPEQGVAQTGDGALPMGSHEKANCDKVVSLPLSTTTGPFRGTVYSDTFSGGGSKTVKVEVKGAYVTPPPGYIDGREDYSVVLRQCHTMIDEDVGTKHVEVIGAPISFTETLPGPGMFSNDAYYLAIKNGSSGFDIDASVKVT